jgi:hypothetical protein
MANITRIKNNQITDSTITYAKIASGTLVGTNFNANLTLNSNVTILGNLTVANSFAQLNSINTYINDPLVVFNNNYTGSPSYDIGILVNRNLSSLAPYGAVNAAFVWKEADTAFEALMTTETGGTAGSISNNGFANIKAGNTTIVSGTVTNALTVGTTLNVTGAATFSSTTLTSGVATVNGNLVAASSTASTNTTTGALVVVGGAGVSGAINAGGNISIGGTNPGFITAAGSNKDLIIDPDGPGNIILSGVTYVNYPTVSSSTTTGALVVSGGTGIAGAINAGSTLTVSGATQLSSTLNVTNTATVNGNLVAASGTASTNTTTGALVVSGGAGVSGSLYIGGAVLSANSAVGFFSSINNTPIGTLTPSTAVFTTTSTSTAQATNFSSGNAQITGGSISGLTNLASGTSVATNFSTGNAQITGGSISGLTNLASGTSVATNFSTSNAQITGGTISGLTALNVTTETATNFATGNAVITGGSVNSTPIGAGTANTGAFTTLTNSGVHISNGNVVAAATTVSTSTNTGALVVNGGVGVAGDVNIGGNLKVSGTLTYINTTTELVGGIEIVAGNLVANSGTASTNTTTGALTVIGGVGVSGSINAGSVSKFSDPTQNTGANTGALQVTNGGAYIAGNLYVGGNINLSTSNINVISGNSAQFFGNAAGFGALYAGIQSGFIFQPQTVLQNSTNFNSYAQVNHQNINSGNQATGDFVVTADTGTSNTNYIDMGMAGSGYVNTSPNNSLGTSLFPLDGYLYVQSNIAGSPGGNLTVGTSVPGTVVKVIAGGIDAANVTATFTGTGFNVKPATVSTSTTSGALTVVGGVGIGGNLNVGVYNTSLHKISGNLLIGQGSVNANTLDTILTINENTDTPLVSNATVHLSGTSGKSAIYGADSFGAATITSSFIGRKARGTSASPTAVQSGDFIAAVTGKGYGTTKYDSSIGSGLTIVATENYTDSAQGSAILLQSIPNGSLTPVTGFKLDQSGNVIITNNTGSSDVQSGALIVNGGAAIGQNLNINLALTVGSTAKIAGNVVLTSSIDTVTPVTGAIVSTGSGGAAFGGNLYTAKTLFIGSAAFTQGFTNPTVAAVNTGSSYAQIAMKNNASSGSADFAAYADTGTDAAGWVDVGIAGSAFSDPAYTITKPQDGYLITRPTGSVAGGNLVITTSEAGGYNDIVIGAGSFFSNAEVARFHGNTTNSGTFTLKLPTNNTATANTGAFQVWGGESIGGNSYIGGGQIINGSQTAGFDYKVRGAADTTLIWARPSGTYDQVVIGGNATPATLIRGAKLQINSTDSFLMPVGTNAQRPGNSGGTDTQGMLRYNSTINGMEVYTGTSWQAFSTSFTVIADGQFNGDGTTVAFTLATAQTTASCIVSINGVVQIPTLAYSVSGTTLTFTEAPASGDVIDVRMLTTTATVTSIASVNGYFSFATDNYGANVYVGSGSTFLATSWNQTGAQVGFLPNVSVASANTATTIDTIDNTQYRSAKYVIQVTNGANYQVQEALVISNGTTATISTYGVISTNGNLGIVTATQSGSNTLVQFIAANATNNVRITKDYLAI